MFLTKTRIFLVAIAAAAMISSTVLAQAGLAGGAFGTIATAGHDICAAGDPAGVFKCHNRWVAYLKTSYR